METIKNDAFYLYEIKKSKFYSYLYYVNDEDDARNKISIIKEKYKDATHYCFGYVVGNVIRFSDDGEPGGTAGMPILNVLTNNNLNHVLAVVVRYFGGIKLGAGGLVRAYTSAVVGALDSTCIVPLKEGYNVTISFMHDNIKTFDNILKDFDIKKDFGEKVRYSFLISNQEFEKLKSVIEMLAVIEKKEETLIR